MERVSTNLMSDNMAYYTQGRSALMNDANSRLASQSRILNLRDDPASAAHAARYESFNVRLERFSDNIQTGINVYNSTEGHMQEALSVMQEVRELAVKGATGTYTNEDRAAMAAEADQLLNHLVMVANAIDGDGTSVFAGQRTKNTPFRVIQGTVPGGTHSMITSVEYTGDIGQRRAEISEGKHIELNFPGNKVFWAENQVVKAPRDARAWAAASDSVFSIDGVEVEVRAGDNIYQLVSRINDSSAAVKAHIDPVSSGLVLETTQAHQLWIKDETGTTLQDLGLLRDANSPPPSNYAKDVSLAGGSLFDMVIGLRNNLLANDGLDTGGISLGGLDNALSNLLGSMGEIGAKTDRLKTAFKRIEKEIPDMAARISVETDIDITKAVTDMKVLELTHEAALAATARLSKVTLLDFLR